MDTVYKNEYIAFESQGYMFAASIEKMGYIIPVTNDIPHVVPPQIPNYVVCVVKLYGECFVLIDLPKLMGGTSIQEESKIIVILLHNGKQIGVLAKNVHKITAYSEELSEDKVTGARVFERDGIQYNVLDIPGLYEYLSQYRERQKR